MHNSSRIVDLSTDPKLQLLNRLIKDCFKGNATHNLRLPPIPTKDIAEDVLPCPRTFDGFSCWDETPPATTVFQPCPDFVVGFDPQRFAYKTILIRSIQKLFLCKPLPCGSVPMRMAAWSRWMTMLILCPRCTENGTWFTHPEADKPWTNYTTCVDLEDLSFRNVVNNIYIIGYSISVAALLLSIIVFVYFRTLHCTRIRIHIHLFASFALNNVLWIVWYKTVVNNVNVVRNNEGWCQVLHIITNYFMVTSYIWMFCEGLHLHIALVVVFVKDEVAMRWFICVGWGVSLIIVTVYAAVRYNIPGATERCWMDQTDAFWIIIVPVVISLVASFVFLINVVRVLLTKLNPAPNQHASLAARKATRAALILIPLFGLHFVLIPLRPSPDTPGEKAYQVVSALLTSLQGLCVAVLFCFTNHDVMIATRTLLTRILRTNDGIALTGITGGESLVNTRENIV